MSVLPSNESMRKVIKWISEEKQNKPEVNLLKVIENATFRFDLSPRDAEFVRKFFKENNM